MKTREGYILWSYGEFARRRGKYGHIHRVAKSTTLVSFAAWYRSVSQDEWAITKITDDFEARKS